MDDCHFGHKQKFPKKKPKLWGLLFIHTKNVLKKKEKKVTIIPRKISPNLAINQKQN